MSSICFYFQVHQPHRIKPYRFFDIGKDRNYFEYDGESDLNNRRIMRKVAQKCYLPANAAVLDLLREHPNFKVAYSISGTALEQFALYAPEVLESFKALIRTGRVELLSETYYHSLAFLHSPREFREQIRMHQDLLFHHFGVRPKVFRNTELIYNNDLAKEIEKLGFVGMLAEGHDHILEWRSPNFVYHAQHNPEFKLLLKNYRLSDDIAFRFGERSWAEYPLTAEKFGSWISGHNGSADVINLFMDYETFGEHQWEDTGIFHFLRALPSEVLKHPDNDFVTPSEACERFSARGEFNAPWYVSWADMERDLSAWLSNPIQHDALRSLYSLEEEVRSTRDKKLLEDWRRLTTSDHFYYMCTKYFNDGDVHAYFNPYNSPFEAFIAFMNVINDIQLRAQKKPILSPWQKFMTACRNVLQV